MRDLTGPDRNLVGVQVCTGLRHDCGSASPRRAGAALKMTA